MNKKLWRIIQFTLWEIIRSSHLGRRLLFLKIYISALVYFSSTFKTLEKTLNMMYFLHFYHKYLFLKIFRIKSILLVIYSLCNELGFSVLDLYIAYYMRVWHSFSLSCGKNLLIWVVLYTITIKKRTESASNESL